LQTFLKYILNDLLPLIDTVFIYCLFVVDKTSQQYTASIQIFSVLIVVDINIVD